MGQERENIASKESHLFPNMTKLFGVVMDAYKKAGAEPEFLVSGTAGDNINRVLFLDVPVNVMSRLYDKVLAKKDEWDCGYTFEYKMVQASDEIKFSFEITSETETADFV